MSLISAIRAAITLTSGATQTLSNGVSDAAGAEVEKKHQQNLSGRALNNETSNEDKKEAEKASQPAVTFTIPEPTGPIKEPEFKPEPLPPLPPKPPPLPPKKLAPINNASKQKPPPARTLQSPSPKKPQSQPQSALGKMAAAREKSNAVEKAKNIPKTDGRSV